MDYTNDKGERLYFPTERAAATELYGRGFCVSAKGAHSGFFRREKDGWVYADIRYNGTGYFIRILIELDNDYSAAATAARRPDGSISASRYLAECDAIDAKRKS